MLKINVLQSKYSGLKPPELKQHPDQPCGSGPFLENCLQDFCSQLLQFWLFLGKISLCHKAWCWKASSVLFLTEVGSSQGQSRGPVSVRLHRCSERNACFGDEIFRHPWNVPVFFLKFGKVSFHLYVLTAMHPNILA